MSKILNQQLASVSRLGAEFGPGILACVTVALAASFLGEHYGAPTMLFALLLGMAFKFLSDEGRSVSGIELASKKVLRIGVALLGMRITFDQILGLGLFPILTILTGVVATILFGLVVSRLMGRGSRFGALTGSAVAICGASAAMAVASVLPKNERSERDTIFTVIAVTALSTLAMIGYPLLMPLIGLDDTEAGVFLGGTIHDVAQVVGAGYSISEETGDTATFIKLLRVATLLPLVFAIAVFMRDHKQSGSAKDQTKPKVPFPWFVLVFAVLVGVNSTGEVPLVIQDGAVSLSRWCLVTAIAALGMKTSLKELSDVGGQAIALVCLETLFLAGLVLGGILLMR